MATQFNATLLAILLLWFSCAVANNLQSKQLLGLTFGCKTPGKVLNWMLRGFEAAIQDYHADRQLFSKSGDQSLFRAEVVSDAEKCKNCLHRVSTHKTRMCLYFTF